MDFKPNWSKCTLSWYSFKKLNYRLLLTSLSIFGRGSQQKSLDLPGDINTNFRNNTKVRHAGFHVNQQSVSPFAQWLSKPASQPWHHLGTQKMQIVRPYPRSTESEPLGVCPSNLCFNKHFKGLKFENHCFTQGSQIGLIISITRQHFKTFWSSVPPPNYWTRISPSSNDQPSMETDD